MKLIIACTAVLVLLTAGPALGLAPLEEVAAEQAKCVETAAEYAEAFAARAPRCVSPDLLGTVSMGATLEEAIAGSGMGARDPADDSDHLLYWFSGPDVLAKYLRIGHPQQIGLSTQANATGLRSASSGLVFLEQIGFPAEYSDVTQTYVLTILPRKVLAAGAKARAADLPYAGGVGPLQPTWSAVRDFVEHAFKKAGLELSDEALTILQNSSFAELSGCPPSCVYSADGFPSTDNPTPIVTDQPGADGKCPAPKSGYKPAVPTALAADSTLCAKDWADAKVAMDALFPADGSCTNAGNAAAGEGLAKALAGVAGDARAQAIHFRAFLMNPCLDFNPLFSGNGMTYTGFGGMLAPLGSEYIASAFEVSDSDREETVQIPFCISGTNGGKPTDAGVCELPAAAASA